MDLVYIPEVLTYGLFRHPQQYRDYEQPWNKDNVDHGKSTSSTHCHRPKQHQSQFQLRSQHHKQYQQPKGLSKENCHLCRESKKRTLAAYIKSKSRKDSYQEIHEEKEEDEQEKQEEKEEENTKEESESTQDTKNNLKINKAKYTSEHKHC